MTIHRLIHSIIGHASFEIAQIVIAAGASALKCRGSSGSDLPACRGWAELEILGATAFTELFQNGLLNTKGEPRRLLAEFRQLRQAQLMYERELGMTPAARMAIKASGTRAALDLAGALAKAGKDVEDADETA